MNKAELIGKIKRLKDVTDAEKSYLIELINTKMKYGLIWEDKPEDVEEQLRSMLPVFNEIEERAIISDDKEAPNHILIEGDNLHALTALTYTHEGKIDLIYIDPPYNTGKANEFKYNDRWVDFEDGYRHSKWLSFISKRLKIAHKLLADDGVMVVSIDDHEIAQLKLLCDEIFNTSPNPKSSNQVGFLVWDLGTGTQAGHFTRANEYILVYCKNKSLLPNFKGGEGIIDDRAQKKIGVKNPGSNFIFPAGTRFAAEDGMELKGSWGGAEKSTLIRGRMICQNGKLLEEVEIHAGWTQKTQMQSFFEGNETVDSKGQKVLEFYFRGNGKIYSRKSREVINPPTVLRDIATTKQGSSLLKSIFNNEEPIQFVKPIQLISWFLQLMPDKKVVLDFFAGSGTTLHSVMFQNKVDGRERQCIIVTNNENNIAEKVAYVRNKRVIQGYTTPKGENIEGLSKNNLRYFKSDFVPAQKTERNRRELTARSTDLLCIKEDCFINQSQDFGLDEKQACLFTNGLGKYMVVMYHTRNQDELVDQLNKVIAQLQTEEKVKVYAFSPEKEIIEDDLFQVADKIEAVPLPDSIYNAYRATFRTLKLDKKEAVNQNSED